jgi:YHS domain-containing protein
LGSFAFASDDHPAPAIGGFDPVAYFTVHQAVRGSGFHVANHEGVSYLFASKENKELFEKNPQKYVPQFNGWCAYGVSLKKKFHADPTIFAVVDGKLYLNLDKEIQKTWEKEKEKNIKKAHNNWSNIKSKDMTSL